MGSTKEHPNSDGLLQWFVTPVENSFLKQLSSTSGGEKVPIQIPSHGNASRSIQPYYRTQPSTLHAIKQECQKKQPSETYHMLEVAGGTESSRSISEEPRNKEQIYNACKHSTNPDVRSKDELLISWRS